MKIATILSIFLLFRSCAEATKLLRSPSRDLSTDGGMHCGCEECSYDAWNTLDAEGERTCGSRIEFLVLGGMTEEDACIQVAQDELPSECGLCNPLTCTRRQTPRCVCPECDTVWDTIADDYTCGSRITFLQTSQLLIETLTEEEACARVGGDEYPETCSLCNPAVCNMPGGQPASPPPAESPVAEPAVGSASPGAFCGCEGCNYDVWHTDAASVTCGARIEYLMAGGVPEQEACFIVAGEEHISECGACNPSECVRSPPRCGCQECEDVWDSEAGGYSCGARIIWLQTSKLLQELYTEEEACEKVSVEEFPDVCGSCSCADIPTPVPEPSPSPITTAPTTATTPITTAPTTATSPTTTAPTSVTSPTDDPYDFSDLIESTSRQVDLMPPKNIEESLIGTRAIPTNKWWTNIISWDPFFPDSNVNFSAYSHPFRITFNFYEDKDYGIDVCYSSDYRIFLDNSENGVPAGYTHAHGSDFIFSAVEFSAAPEYKIIDWDDFGFGVKVELRDASGGGTIVTDLVAGMPFVTANYRDGLTPKLSTVHQILTVDGENIVLDTPSSFTGTKFIITNNKGQKWVIYSTEEITFNADLSSLEASSGFQDITLRIALLPDGTSDTLYDPFWSCIVTGGSLEIFNDSSYGIRWTTQGDCSGGLLHLGLPHHDEVLSKADLTDVGLNLLSATRGTMKGWATPGNQDAMWTMDEIREDIPVQGFYPPRAPVQSLIESYDVLGVLQDEINAEFQIDTIGYYAAGKQAQKYATMCLLAANTYVNTDVELLDLCIEKLEAAFDKFLKNEFDFPLVYDNVYRGVVTSEGFERNNVNADFGATTYNDHHFHYGYWIFAGAALKELDPTWERMPELNKIITTLIRDTANSYIDNDAGFPLFRHFDWYSGHSSSHGLIPFFDGKDQESTGEAMNFLYSLMLWGQASGESDLEILGRLMMKVEKRSLGMYLLMEDSNVVHPEIVPNKVVGLFLENKVSYTTWFGDEREYIHGIQMIPISPILEFLRTETFVREEYEAIIQNLDIISDPDNHRGDPWQSLLFADSAVISKEVSMFQLSQSTMDDGLSQAWALYFAATRP